MSHFKVSKKARSADSNVSVLHYQSGDNICLTFIPLFCMWRIKKTLLME